MRLRVLILVLSAVLERDVSITAERRRMVEEGEGTVVVGGADRGLRSVQGSTSVQRESGLCVIAREVGT